MKTTFAFLLTALVSAIVSAAAMDENLIFNPQFRESKQKLLHLAKNIEANYPDGWGNDEQCAPCDQIVYLRDGGPNGLPAMVLKGGPKPVTVSQYGFKLVPGGKYRFQAKLKLTDFKAKQAFIALYDWCWCKDVKLYWGPASTADWFTVSTVFTAPSSPNELYGIGIHANDFTGELRLADVSLTPADDASAQGAQACMEGTPKRLIPVSLNLHRLPAHNAVIQLGYPVRLPEEGSGRYEAVLKLGGKAYRAPFANGFATVHVESQEPGLKTFSAVLVDHVSKTELASSAEHSCRFVQDAADTVQATAGKRLNRQVVELVNAALPQQGLDFSMAADGWVYIGLDSKAASQTFMLDDKPCSLERVGDKLETLRHVSAGIHRLVCPGTDMPGGTRVIVRRIPELFTYPIFRPLHVKEEQPCDEPFSRKYIFPSCTTFNMWGLPGGAPKTRQLQSEGKRILGSIGFRTSMKPTTADELLPKIFAAGKVNDGATLDEIAFIDAPATLRSLLDAYWKHGDAPASPLHYLWVGFADYCAINPGLHQELCSAVANVNGGSGRIVLEDYACTVDSEQKASENLEHTFVNGVSALESLVPGIRSRLICCLSSYCQPYTFNNDRSAGVDFKVLLDRACRLIAASEALTDLGGIGLYNTSAADEETVQWFFALMRHYFIEGHTDSLAERYGFAYAPGLLRNSDFADGASGWTVRPAAEGSIAFDQYPGYGASVQHRAKDAGDRFCVMTRNSKAPNIICQTITGLVPGKMYSVRTFVVDQGDVEKKAVRPERFAFRTEVIGGRIIPKRTYVHVDDRPVKEGGIRTNTHKVVFCATGPTAELRFSDWLSDDAPGGPVGQRLSFNFIQVKPYFMPED